MEYCEILVKESELDGSIASSSRDLLKSGLIATLLIGGPFSLIKLTNSSLAIATLLCFIDIFIIPYK